VGFHVKNLKRVRVGKLELGTMPIGHLRELTEDEKKLIFK